MVPSVGPHDPVSQAHCPIPLCGAGNTGSCGRIRQAWLRAGLLIVTKKCLNVNSSPTLNIWKGL